LEKFTINVKSWNELEPQFDEIVIKEGTDGKNQGPFGNMPDTAFTILDFSIPAICQIRKAISPY
jgi:hypothetical protein